MRAQHVFNNVTDHKHRIVKIPMSNYADAFALTLIIMMMTYKNGNYALILPEAMLLADEYNKPPNSN